MTARAFTRIVRAGRLSLMLGLVMASAAPLGAQRRGGAAHPGRAQLEQRVRARMAQMMRRELGLSDDEAHALNEVTSEFQSKRRELAARQRELVRKASALARRGPREVRDEELRSVLAAIADVHDEEARLYRAEQQRLLEILTPWQVLRLNLMRERFAEQIRRMRRERPGGRPGMRPPGGPGEDDAPWSHHATATGRRPSHPGGGGPWAGRHGTR